MFVAGTADDTHSAILDRMPRALLHTAMVAKYPAESNARPACAVPSTPHGPISRGESTMNAFDGLIGRRLPGMLSHIGEVLEDLRQGRP